MTMNIQNWSSSVIEEWIPDEKPVDSGVAASWADSYLTLRCPS
jgi:hypothetical protein